ncbi:hypothetical protein [Catenuloplanes japonicus]|uniref:hypothetical protein n=1 Tax=Catenuloplanes japonicus TaxID=33876 RepID=UPI0005259CEF|nr:hypothetical protein [Catenuloplanes japonicus]
MTITATATEDFPGDDFKPVPPPFTGGDPADGFSSDTEAFAWLTESGAGLDAMLARLLRRQAVAR